MLIIAGHYVEMKKTNKHEMTIIVFQGYSTKICKGQFKVHDRVGW